MRARRHIGESRRRRRREAGFTLVEIMVALVAGALAITSIYFVSAASARHFHEQQRIAQSQMSLRMAMEQVRRDFSRAGYLGTPNTAEEQRCVDSPWAFGAVLLEDGAGTSVLTEATTNAVEADRVELIGNYATSDSYLMIDAGGVGNRASFQKSWQGFRRSFGVPYDATAQALFEQVFTTDRFVHITTPTGNHFFAAITAVDAAADPPSIDFSPALPIGSPCVPGLCDGCTITPLERIEYTVLDTATAGEVSSLSSPASAAVFAGLDGPVLVRREVGMGSAGAAIANSERIIAEYVADFDVDFVSNTNLTVGTAPTLVLDDDGTAETRTTNEPHLVRSARVRLSVRTAAEDPRYPYPSGGATDPLTRYELDPLAPGAARVRTANAEILIPNLAMRDLR
jgi:prepilin-type N-terminal cleavage/methylation domain-containing protein